MPDLDDDLFSSFKDEGAPVNPLPAAEVRRRGDRMRRRNNTLAAVGGVAAALVVIATPLAVVANQGTDASDDFVTRPTQVAWLQEIPVGVDVSAGIQGLDESQDPGPQDGPLVTLDVCGETVFDGGDATVDASSATYRSEGELVRERTLAVYPTGADAADAADELRTAVSDCPTAPGAADGDRVELDLEQGELAADDSFLVTQGFYGAGEDFPTLGTDYYVVARTGNALLVTRTSGLADDPAVDELQAERDDVAEVVADLQVFSETTTVPETDGTASLGTTIPDDFDLLAGFPEDAPDARPAFGREGPSRDLDLTVYNYGPEACGIAAVLPTPTDTLYAGWREAAGGQLRQLMTFASAAEAQSYADALLQVYADCPEDTDRFGATKVYDLADEPRVADFAGSVVMHPEVDGEVGPGYQVIQVVRVGSAVLHFVATYDGVDPVDPATAVADLTTTYLNANGAVISAM